MVIFRLIACLLASVAVLAALNIDLGSREESQVFGGTPWFEDVTAEMGLDFVHDPGPVPTDDHYFMPQIVGSGAALFDNDPRCHFGLGATAYVSGMEVLRPDGTTEKFLGSPADRFVVLRKGEGLQ